MKKAYLSKRKLKMAIPKASPRPRVIPMIPLPIFAFPSGKAPRATVLRGALRLACPMLFKLRRKKMKAMLVQSVIVERP